MTVTGLWVLIVVGAFTGVGLAATPAALGPHESGQGGSFEARLEQAARGEWNDLHLVCECRGEGNWRSLELFGSGVGIWLQKRQFRLTPGQVLEIVRVLQESGFADMPAVFGGNRDPQVPRFAKRVTCRVGLELDGASKEVSQLAKGVQSEEFRVLAERLLELAEEPGNRGVSADSLRDGLEKIASRVLAPELLRILVNRKPWPPGKHAGCYVFATAG